jgi:SAM-dependent methyltransferase
VSALAERLGCDAALSTWGVETAAWDGAADTKLAMLETHLGAEPPMLWVYAFEGQPILRAADVAVTIDWRGRLSLASSEPAARTEQVVPTPKPPEDIGLLEPGPLPYQDGLADAERVGRVLHRQDIYSSGPPVDAISGEIFDFVARNTGSSVLDVGCGIGPYVDHLTRIGRQCVGVDLDTEAVDAAKRLGRDVRLMSAYDLEFPDNSFDSVILVETLEHLDDFHSALAEAARVARGTIVVTVPDISVIPFMSKRLVVPWHLLEATHVNFFTPETLRKTLLRYAPSCDASRLGAFFEVDGVPIHMHAAAVATLEASAAT